MFNAKWKIKLISTPLIVAFFGLFIRYVPWLFGSKPIHIVEDSGVDNLPAPVGALSYAINHGSAMYYYEPIPSEAPVQTTLVILAFIIVIGSLKYLDIKSKRLLEE